MKFDEGQSVRKRYLMKVYRRALNCEKDKGSNDNVTTCPNANTSFSSNSNARETPSPILIRSVTPNAVIQNFSLQSETGSNIILKFLEDLILSKGKNKTLLMPVKEILKENFDQNPEIPLILHNKLKVILSKLAENFSNFQGIEREAKEIIKHLTQSNELSELKSSISRINLKVVSTLKRFLPTKEPVQSLSFAYLVLFSNADPYIYLPTKSKFSSSLVISTMQKYTLVPGRMIQTCRKLPDLIHSHEISKVSIKYTQKILSKINPQTLQDIDKSQSLSNLYSFIKLSVLYFYSFHLPIKTPIPEPLPCIPQCNLNEDLFCDSLDDRFKSFLRTQVMPNLVQVEARMELLDRFVEEIREEIRSTVFEEFCK